MPIITFALLLMLATLSACGSAPLSVEETTQDARHGPIATDLKPAYLEYVDGMTGHGRPLILFFASKDDPFSLQTEKILLAAYASGAVRYSTVRVEGEKEKDLQLRYGVFIPNTFVLLDAAGKRLGALVHPTKKELNTLLLSGFLPQEK